MDEKIVQQKNISLPTKKRGNPNWRKGMKSPNPKGQALGKEYLRTLLTQGFDKDEKLHKENLITYAFKQARIDNGVLIALLKKLLPDQIQGEGFGDTYNIYNLINRIQQEFISKDSEPSLVLDRGNGMDAGRTRPENTVQEIPKQGIS